MVRNANDVPGLKILNSPPSERDSSNNGFESNTHKAKKDVSSGKWKKQYFDSNDSKIVRVNFMNMT